MLRLSRCHGSQRRYSTDERWKYCGCIVRDLPCTSIRIIYLADIRVIRRKHIPQSFAAISVLGFGKTPDPQNNLHEHRIYWIPPSLYISSTCDILSTVHLLCPSSVSKRISMSTFPPCPPLAQVTGIKSEIAKFRLCALPTLTHASQSTKYYSIWDG